ncbi:MAG TPA: FeoA family protein [Bacteroidia bacterium]|jgi:ferrous iron transport protein A|nr:FeoA family protein [Bacteroidia bacterium]
MKVLTRTLAQLIKGETATISSFSDDVLALKLIEMGCIPGEKITLQHVAPLGCPYAFEVNGTLVSIRKSEAQFVLISK